MQRRLIIFLIILCVVATGFWSVATSHRAAKADSISTLLSGSAYGMAIQAGSETSELSSGPFAEVSTLCTPYPTDQQQTLPRLTLMHGLINGSAIQDKLTFNRSDGQSSVEASSIIGRITIGSPLLQPLLQVDGLHAVARSNASIGNATSATDTSFFGTIKIAGIHLPLRIAPNTALFVSGLGKIVLNEQIKRNTNLVTTYAEVNMIDITLGLANLLHRPEGMHIIIGHSVSSDGIVSVLAAMQGHAYGLATNISVGQLAHSRIGPLPNTAISCLGGTNAATAARLKLPGLVDSGIADTKTTGVLDQNTATVAVLSTEKIVNLSLLGGLIKVGQLQAYAHAVYDSTGGKSDGNFTAANLYVGEQRLLPHTYLPNTRINLAGLGYVIVDETLPSTLGYSVNALDVGVTTENKWSLPVGLHIIIGHVDTNITLFR
ncbi:MAG TPA: choice-of-anchor P family protein [Ktedonobacteraceae bacterium]